MKDAIFRNFQKSDKEIPPMKIYNRLSAASSVIEIEEIPDMLDYISRLQTTDGYFIKKIKEESHE